MKWYVTATTNEHRGYEIKHDPLVGYYLCVFEDDKCIRDYLQDTFEIAIECAEEDYGVPRDAWTKVDD